MDKEKTGEGLDEGLRPSSFLYKAFIDLRVQILCKSIDFTTYKTIRPRFGSGCAPHSYRTFGASYDPVSASIEMLASFESVLRSLPLSFNFGSGGVGPGDSACIDMLTTYISGDIHNNQLARK